MSTRAKLLGFLVSAAAVFGIALAFGRLVGPVDAEVSAAHDDSHTTVPAEGGQEDDAAAQPAAQTQIPGGLMVSQNGYTLALTDETSAAGTDVPVTFTITGPDGTPVTEYDVEHEKKLHLIAVRRDFSGFQHVHPTMDEDGVWSTDLDLTPGTWRIFADFKVTGAEALTLGNDLLVTGDYQPAKAAEATRTATVGDYDIALSGDLRAGTDAKLTLGVTRDGEPVTDLEPYLGAYGHLVALRAGDLAYLHVHPDGTPGDGTTTPGPDVVFYAAVPSAGIYHLYLDFKHEGKVRTAEFTVTVGEDADQQSDPAPSPEEPDGHSDH